MKFIKQLSPKWIIVGVVIGAVATTAVVVYKKSRLPELEMDMSYPE